MWNPKGRLTARSFHGVKWDEMDIARFYTYCREGEVPLGLSTPCLIWIGGKSRGRGNKAWYGSFRVKGKTVRAHKFAGIAIYGFRPLGTEHIDHICRDSLCVRHLQCIPAIENLKLRWARASRTDYEEDVPF